MRYFIAAALSLAAGALAQDPNFLIIDTPDFNEVLTSCTTYSVKWRPNNAGAAPVTFQLIGGTSQATLVPLGTAFTVADPTTVNSYAWSVPCDESGKAVYGLKAVLDSDANVFQFSKPFQIAAANGGGSSSSTSVTSSTTASNTASTQVPTTTRSATSMETTYTIPTSATNGTITTYKPTKPTSFETSTVTEGTTPTDTDGPAQVNGGARIVSGSLAFLGVAAAFLAL